jgi:hypothetical protein
MSHRSVPMVLGWTYESHENRLRWLRSSRVGASPTPLQQGLRRVYRGPGGVGCSEGEHYTSPENSAGGRVLSDAISYAPVLAADI